MHFARAVCPLTQDQPANGFQVWWAPCIVNSEVEAGPVSCENRLPRSLSNKNYDCLHAVKCRALTSTQVTGSSLGRM